LTLTLERVFPGLPYPSFSHSTVRDFPHLNADP
jgi:hypothetical protein